jgi:hypothetical protein
VKSGSCYNTVVIMWVLNNKFQIIHCLQFCHPVYLNQCTETGLFLGPNPALCQQSRIIAGSCVLLYSQITNPCLAVAIFLPPWPELLDESNTGPKGYSGAPGPDVHLHSQECQFFSPILNHCRLLSVMKGKVEKVNSFPFFLLPSLLFLSSKSQSLGTKGGVEQKYSKLDKMCFGA